MLFLEVDPVLKYVFQIKSHINNICSWNLRLNINNSLAYFLNSVSKTASKN